MLQTGRVAVIGLMQVSEDTKSTAREQVRAIQYLPVFKANRGLWLGRGGRENQARPLGE